MNLHVITEHTTLHHKALACLLLMEAATTNGERKQYAAKYAGFMEQLCSKAIEKALQPENMLHPVMKEAIDHGFSFIENHNKLGTTNIVAEVS
jgi:hypothetical protein